MSTAFNPDDIQGNILRGYRYKRVRYLVLEVVDRAAARSFLAASAAGSSAEVPAITRATKWAQGRKPIACFNVGMTYDGLRALGTASGTSRDVPDGVCRRDDQTSVETRRFRSERTR